MTGVNKIQHSIQLYLKINMIEQHFSPKYVKLYLAVRELYDIGSKVFLTEKFEKPIFLLQCNSTY